MGERERVGRLVCCGFYEVKKKPSSSCHANGIYITLIVPHHRGYRGGELSSAKVKKERKKVSKIN